MPVVISLAEAYLHSRSITRTYAKTFYFASHFLNESQRKGSYAIYAFCRTADSVTDEPHACPTSALEQLQNLVLSPEGNLHLYPWAPAWYDTIETFNIPKELFLELIEGVKMDLYKSQYETFDELYLYCYRVASVVGLMMVPIFGYRSAEALYYAEKLGVAMQLTNILRDVGEDLDRGRIYLPLRELQSFGYDAEALRARINNASFYECMRFQVRRARSYYEEGRKGIPLLEGAAARSTVRIMARLYEGILDKLEAENYPCLEQRVYVRFPEKVLLSLPEISGELRYSLFEGLKPAARSLTAMSLLLGLCAWVAVPAGLFSEWKWMDNLYLYLWAGAALSIISSLPRGIVGALIAAGIGAVAELIGLHTGWIFGHYAYTEILQPQVGGVPLPIILAWGGLVGLASGVGGTLPKILRAVFVAGWMVGIDLVLEVFAVQARSYWIWQSGIVPLQNYLAWAGVAAIASFFLPAQPLTKGALWSAYALMGTLIGLLGLGAAAIGEWKALFLSLTLLGITFALRQAYEKRSRRNRGRTGRA